MSRKITVEVPEYCYDESTRQSCPFKYLSARCLVFEKGVCHNDDQGHIVPCKECKDAEIEITPEAFQ